MTTAMTAMAEQTAEQTAELAALYDLETAELEQVVSRGVRTFMEVGTALKILQERRAYLDRGYAGFEDYCRALWGFGRQYGYRLIAAVETTSALTVANGDTDDPPPPPANEAQARALAPLRDRPFLLGHAWRCAVETAPEGRITAQHVARVVARVVVEVEEQEAQAQAARAARLAAEAETLGHRARAAAQPAAPVDLLSAPERELRRRVEAGETVVASFRVHQRLIEWAGAVDLFVRVDRQSRWGNPFELPEDGDRATVIDHFERYYLPHKPGLVGSLDDLRGKVLGCWCAPEPCHGDVLKRWAEKVREAAG